jgi:hypothetical protein
LLRRAGPTPLHQIIAKTPYPRELTIKAMNYLKTSGRVSIVGGVVELVG